MDGYSWIVLLTLILTVMAVGGIRKRKDYTYSLLDTSGMILNTVLIVMIYPPLAVACGLLAAEQLAASTSMFAGLATAMARLMPAISVAGVGASVILRRKEYPVPSFWMQFAGGVWFGITMLLVNCG